MHDMTYVKGVSWDHTSKNSGEPVCRSRNTRHERCLGIGNSGESVEGRRTTDFAKSTNQKWFLQAAKPPWPHWIRHSEFGSASGTSGVLACDLGAPMCSTHKKLNRVRRFTNPSRGLLTIPSRNQDANYARTRRASTAFAATTAVHTGSKMDEGSTDHPPPGAKESRPTGDGVG